MFAKRLLGRIWPFLVTTLLFREVGVSTKRGRNQLRIAAGLAAIAGAGFSVVKLIDPPVQVFDFWMVFYAAAAAIMLRASVWLLLTVEGGEE